MSPLSTFPSKPPKSHGRYNKGLDPPSIYLYTLLKHTLVLKCIKKFYSDYTLFTLLGTHYKICQVPIALKEGRRNTEPRGIPVLNTVRMETGEQHPIMCHPWYIHNRLKLNQGVGGKSSGDESTSSPFCWLSVKFVKGLWRGFRLNVKWSNLCLISPLWLHLNISGRSWVYSSVSVFLERSELFDFSVPSPFPVSMLKTGLRVR